LRPIHTEFTRATLEELLDRLEAQERGAYESTIHEDRLKKLLDRLEMQEAGGYQSAVSERWEVPQPAEAAEAQLIRLSIQRGIPDGNRLTDIVFNARHPERRGQRLQSHERQLIREWLDIRNRLVRPALLPHRLRVYQMSRQFGLVHSKLILADDQALSIGSANADPRGFFWDTELNVMLNDAEAVRRFRNRLWAHDLGVPLEDVQKWAVSELYRPVGR
jgi:hypothetical protein